jgi:hypothetical protein
LGQACELIKVQFVQIGISHDGESRAACAQACRKQGCSKAREAPLTTHKQAVGLNPESVLSKTMTTTCLRMHHASGAPEKCRENFSECQSSRRAGPSSRFSSIDLQSMLATVLFGEVPAASAPAVATTRY